jgi:hypothetical protein
MQTANNSDQNNILVASQETTNYRIRMITYHRDGTVTVWDVSRQRWVRTNDPSDQLLDSLCRADADRIRWFVKNGVKALTTS